MSPYFRLLPLGLILAAPASMHAADADSSVSAGYHLKNKSSFSASETVRPPFWPIGYVHRGDAPKNAAPVVEFKLDPDQFNVTSILMGAPSLAVINGRTYAEGEFLRAPRRGKAVTDGGVVQVAPSAKIRVAKVSDGAVVLEVAGQRASVPLRRPQLQPPKAGDDLDVLNQ
jgi:hypothetical protein